jgi:hypothetical protein
MGSNRVRVGDTDFIEEHAGGFQPSRDSMAVIKSVSYVLH